MQKVVVKYESKPLVDVLKLGYRGFVLELSVCKRLHVCCGTDPKEELKHLFLVWVLSEAADCLERLVDEGDDLVFDGVMEIHQAGQPVNELGGDQSLPASKALARGQVA